MDTNDLTDIPEYFSQIKTLRLPKGEYTAQDVTSQTQLSAFADEKALSYAVLFVKLVLSHLSASQVHFQKSRIQTDHGEECIGSWNAKKESVFIKTVASFDGITHTTIPARAHTWQADVETVYRLIEDEFYEIESFTSRQDFLNKASAYILWFNLARKNSHKDNKTPWQMIQEKHPHANPSIPLLPPVFLDELFTPSHTHKRDHEVIPQPLLGDCTFWMSF